MIDLNNLVYTCGVMAMKGQGFDSEKEDYVFTRCIALAVKDEFDRMPDECLDGGNDKHFFTIKFRNTKMFVAENEVNGLTVMLPDEY